ncbi:unnamed protein product [Symbiodinium sp. CCMP2592]|nr:unnamed protein product [Symbiodinium sp. CCMP2592]CAE7816187.1 unnamed protein product [Symbiodinium sp. CCMP2592]
MWAMVEARPYTCKELLEIQGIPMFDDSLRAAGQRTQVLNMDNIGVSPAAQKHMAGNSFHQACVTAFLAFTLASLTPKPISADHCSAEEEKRCVALMQRGEDLVPVIAELGRAPSHDDSREEQDQDSDHCGEGCTDDDEDGI